MAKENRRQREMEFYRGIPFNEQKQESPDNCIYCNSKVITVIKKLPRTFSCSNQHQFTITEFRAFKKKSI